MDTTQRVLASINRIYGIEATFEYPGYIQIPERFINDDVDASDDAWAVGPDDEGEWTGQLMSPDGEVVRGMTFAVYPNSDNPDDIAAAIYTHGIGDLYIGGGCADPDCPRKAKVSR